MALGLVNVPGTPKGELEAANAAISDLRDAVFGEGGAVEEIYDDMANVAEQAGGLVAQGTPPENVKKGWIDTSSGGVLKYYNGSKWVAVNAVWG